jgi:hypothetical protein
VDPQQAAGVNQNSSGGLWPPAPGQQGAGEKQNRSGGLLPPAPLQQAAGVKQTGSGGLWPPARGSQWLHCFAAAAAEFFYWRKLKL